MTLVKTETHRIRGEAWLLTWIKVGVMPWSLATMERA